MIARGISKAFGGEDAHQGWRRYKHLSEGKPIVMTRRIRRCAECPKCHTRYLIGFSPYRNGSDLRPLVAGSCDEYMLSCSCGRPFTTSRWRWIEFKPYAVSRAAHKRVTALPTRSSLYRMTALHSVHNPSPDRMSGGDHNDPHRFRWKCDVTAAVSTADSTFIKI
jgi:hypothetical protein